MTTANWMFGYLNDFYDLLPEDDSNSFAEVWQAYVRIYGDFWAQTIDRDASTSIQYMPLYNTQRWRPYELDSTTAVAFSATYQTLTDLSQGVNLVTKYLFRFAIDGGSPIQVNLQGYNPASTLPTEIVATINAAAGFTFAKLVLGNSLILLTSSTSGPNSSIQFLQATSLPADAGSLITGLDLIDNASLTFPTFPYTYQLGDTAIASIPALQDKIHDELVAVSLTEGANYSIQLGTGIISFAATPPAIVWAKNTLVNYEVPYNNFGYLMNIYDSNTAQYQETVQGLWYAFWTGPRPENIRRSLYLLFGLPVAGRVGTVTSQNSTTITLTYTDTTTETFNIPSQLVSIVTNGEAVTQFQPLVSGISVLDKISQPGWVATDIGRYGIQYLLTENATRGLDPNTDESRALKTIEQNAYLPQIDVNAFAGSNVNLANVKSFLGNMQPKSRTFLFQVLVATLQEQLTIEEAFALGITIDVTSNTDSNPNTWAQESDLTDAETDPATGICLDTEVIKMVETALINVYNSSDILIDTYTLEG
jgi:hypothetical protein